MIETVDLTLTMTGRHRRAALKLAPRAMFRTYTLREAAALLPTVDQIGLPPVSSLDDRARELVAALGRQRATRPASDRESDDVLDPIGRSETVHQRVGDMIFEALIPLLQAMTGGGAEEQVEPLVPARRVQVSGA